jgi:uncharacterized protein YbaR (Trm112 family)
MATILACPHCSGNKPKTSRTLGVFKAYTFHNDILLICRSCNHKIKIKLISDKGKSDE